MAVAYCMGNHHIRYLYQMALSEGTSQLVIRLLLYDGFGEEEQYDSFSDQALHDLSNGSSGPKPK